MPRTTSLAKITAEWDPGVRLPELRAAHALTAQKWAALDFSTAGTAAMLRQIDAALSDEEDNLSRRRTLTAARKGLEALAAGTKPGDWFPLIDVLAYWPACAEIIAQRQPLPPPPTEEERRAQIMDLLRHIRETRDNAEG